MTAQVAGIAAALMLIIWLALNLRHVRNVARWAQGRSRPRIPRDDQERATILAAGLVALLVVGLLLQLRLAFVLTILLSAAGTIVESAVRVAPHLRASEQRLATDHVILSLPLLAALILAVMGWNRLPPLV